MHKFVAAAALALAAFFAPGLHAQADASGAKDHPSIARFPGMAIVSATQDDFGAHEKPVAGNATEAERAKNRRVELVKQ
jgi:hypothetical protein